MREVGKIFNFGRRERKEYNDPTVNDLSLSQLR